MSPGHGELVGMLDDFPAGAWRVAAVRGREVGIYNTGERVYAVLDVCPHQGAPLCIGALAGTMLPGEPGRYAYGLDGRVLRCPWHGWEFDVLTGEMLFGTGPRRLTVYPVTVDDGRVFVDPNPKGR